MSNMQRTQSFGTVLGMHRSSTPSLSHSSTIEPRTGNSSPLTCGLYIGKICTGAGLLGLPKVYDDAGVVIGILMTVALVGLNIISCRILVRCRDTMLVAKLNQQHARSNIAYDLDYNADSYNELAAYTLGTVGLRVVDISITICLLGVVALYTITFCQLMTEVISAVSRIYFIVAALVFLLPFSLIRDLSGLSFVSALSTIAYVVAFVCIFTYGAMYGRHDIMDNTQISKFGDAQALTRSFGMLTFSLGIPVMALTLEEELQQPQQFKSVLNKSMAIVCVAYIAIGVAGVVLFDNVQPIIISNLPSNSVITAAVKLTVAITLLLSCPLSLSPALNLIEHLCFHQLEQPSDSIVSNSANKTYGSVEYDNSDDDSHKHDTASAAIVNTGVFTMSNCVRIIALLTVTTIAFTIPCFQLLMSVLGCITFSLLCFILPSVMYIQLHRAGLDTLYAEYIHAGHRPDTPSEDGDGYGGRALPVNSTTDWSPRTHAVLNYAFVAIGLLVSVVSTYEVISHAKCE